MKIKESHINPLVWIGVVLFSYCVWLTFFTGDAGFEGDDWWILSRAYWNDYPNSILIYAKEFQRPVEGAYWMTLFELFGFNKIAFHFCSLLLLAGASILMGFCLFNAFPQRRPFYIFAPLLSFFMPMVSCLTYVMCTDNSRLSMLLFWGSVLGFQKWAMDFNKLRNVTWAILLYLAAFFTYECSSFLIFAVPFLALPVYQRYNSNLPIKRFAVLFGIVICVPFLIAVVLRIFLLHGGAVGQNHLTPPINLIFGYLGLVPFYLAQPFRTIATNPGALFAGISIMLITFSILFFISRSELVHNKEETITNGFPYIFGLGLLIFILGMAPYQLAGYGNAAPTLMDTLQYKIGLASSESTNWFNFNWSSRIYSAASFGLTIILALIFTGFRNRKLSIFSQIAGIAFIGTMAIFHTGLSTDWQRAAEHRSQLVKSLLSIVPEVKPGSNLVFLNLESYCERAAIFRGWGGLRELVKILYNEQNTGAWYLFPDKFRKPNQYFNQALVLKNGFISRGMDLKKPAPHDSLIILKRTENSLTIVDEISPQSDLVKTGIAWQGADLIKTNYDKISGWSNIASSPHKPYRDAWTSGFIATLQLSRLTLNFDLFSRRRTSSGTQLLTKNIFEKIRLANRSVSHLNVLARPFEKKLINIIQKKFSVN
jgi:hypothetical protein